jgi:anti-anti-sigma regulatory factor
VIARSRLARFKWKEIYPMSAKLTTREKGEVTTVDINSSPTLSQGCSALRKKLWELAQNGSKRILVNMAEVTSIDSFWIGAFVVQKVMDVLRNPRG